MDCPTQEQEESFFFARVWKLTSWERNFVFSFLQPKLLDNHLLRFNWKKGILLKQITFWYSRWWFFPKDKIWASLNHILNRALLIILDTKQCLEFCYTHNGCYVTYFIGILPLPGCINFTDGMKGYLFTGLFYQFRIIYNFHTSADWSYWKQCIEELLFACTQISSVFCCVTINYCPKMY